MKKKAKVVSFPVKGTQEVKGLQFDPDGDPETEIDAVLQTEIYARMNPAQRAEIRDRYLSNAYREIDKNWEKFLNDAQEMEVDESVRGFWRE